MAVPRTHLRPPPIAPGWFQSPNAVHDSRSLGFESQLGRRPRGAAEQRDVAGSRRDGPFSSSLRRPEVWHPPIQPLRPASSSEDDGDPHFQSENSAAAGSSATANMFSHPSHVPPPSLIGRELLQDPAFAPDNRFNPNLWSSHGAIDPTISESYVVPFARGLPGPAPYEASALRPNDPPQDVQQAAYDPPTFLLASPPSPVTPLSSDDHSRLPYLQPSVSEAVASHDSSEKRSKRVLKKERERRRDAPPKPTSPQPLPTYEESVSDHSSTTPSTPSTPAATFSAREKQAPVVLSYNPPPPEPLQPPRPEPMKRQSRRPAPHDLDSIDELDESSPYGAGIHHNGPYEAITAALGRGGEGSQVKGPPMVGERRKRQSSNPARSNPVKLNLKPGQVLKGSIFQPVQPNNPQPYPFHRAPATYPPNPSSSHPGPSYQQPNQAGPSGLHRSYTTPATDVSPSPRGPDGPLPETDPYVFNPLKLIPTNARSRSTFVNGYTTARPAPQEEQPMSRSRGPHDRPALFVPHGESAMPSPYSPLPPTRPNEQPSLAPARSSLPNPYSPLPPTRSDEQAPYRPQRSSIPNPYSPLPPGAQPSEHHVPPRAEPQPRPASIHGSIVDLRRETPRRSSPPSSYSPPRRPSPPQRGRTSSNPGSPPTTTMANLNLNRSSPDIRTGIPSVRTGTPSVRTNGSQGPLLPRHIPRRLVMPTPLARSEPLPVVTPPRTPHHPTQPEAAHPSRPHHQLPAAPPYLPRGAAPAAPAPNVRFAHAAPPPRIAETVVRYEEGARNLLRKRSAPPAPPTRPDAGNGNGNGSSGGTGFLAVFGFCKTGNKAEVRQLEVRADGSGVEVKRAQTMKEVSKSERPRRVLSKRK